jgi:hypothetical protein
MSSSKETGGNTGGMGNDFAFFPILLQTYHAFLVNAIEKFSIGKNEVEELDIVLHNGNWKSLVLCIWILHLL